jgi:hypothetical protein
MKKTNKFRKAFIFIAAAAGISAFMTGCDENGGITIPSGATELTVSAKSNNNLDNPPANIVITEAKALISKVEFEQESNQHNQVIKDVPFVVNFNTDGTLKEIVTSYIIRDLYTKAKFQIHKVEDNETSPDPEFVSGSQRYSFIIKGTFNGNAFVYKSKKSANVVINLSKTVNINLKKMNLTILFNPAIWFASGSNSLNPADPQNENAIDDNIKNSYRQAFEDENKDGNPDN